MADLGIPVAVDDVTPNWLAVVLDAPVIGVESLAAHSGTTGRLRVALTYADDAARPRSVFVKLPPFDERQRRFVDITGLGVAEAIFYRDLARSVPLRVPDVYYAATDDDGRYIMVLEDLVASDGRFPRMEDDDIAALTGRIVTELGHLHAQYWEQPVLTAELGWLTEGNRQAFAGGGSFIGRALERFGDDMPPVFGRLARLYTKEAPGIAELYARGPHTLVHGDPHLGNLFVDGDRPGFYDWGMVMRRTGMWDVAYVLCNGLPPEVRRTHEHEWIASYRETLAGGGIEFDESLAWEQYRLFAVYAWSSATSTAGVGSRWQPEDYGRHGMKAATTAVDDLDSVDLLESLLA
ncbi:MAG: phosphotransferase family protein [Acidimicrobiia bacterium]